MSTTLYWFTNDLRFDDNPALERAARAESLICAYALDPKLLRPGRYQLERIGKHRHRFLMQSLANLDEKLQATGQKLWLSYESPLDMLSRIITANRVKQLICSRQLGLYERHTLAQLRRRFADVDIVELDTYTLYNLDSLPFDIAQWPRHFTNFKLSAEQDQFPPPLAPPGMLPKLSHDVLTIPLPEPYQTDCDVGNISPDQMGQDMQTRYVGGEDAAQQRLHDYFDSALPADYKNVRNALEGFDHSSKFSVWLNHGCLSARRLKERIATYEQNKVKNESTYWLFFELLWREFFQWSGVHLGTALFRFGGDRRRKPLTSFYNERFKAWTQGTTPYPLVNACMQELEATGYLSNRGRQIVASALVNELQVDWRYGAAWFEKHLIDYDVHSNWGNWQYIAGVGADPRGGRHFNLEKQTQQYDADGQYRKRWCPDEPPRHSAAEKSEQGHARNADQPTLLDTRDAADWPIGY